MVRKIISGITLLISILLISCNDGHIKKSVFKTKDGKGYCYQDQDDMLWYYIIYNQQTGMYDVSPATGTPDYYSDSSVSLDLSSANVSDFDSVSSSMSETTGESGNGSDATEADSSGGMSESTGESGDSSDSGSSDSGSSDAGGGDGGGGDGGGGGE